VAVVPFIIHVRIERRCLVIFELTFIPLIDGSISSGFPLSRTFLCMVCELKDSFSLLVDSAAASSCDYIR
jgi:hypothetical protein